MKNYVKLVYLCSLEKKININVELPFNTKF